jgi:hypothetical protein
MRGCAPASFPPLGANIHQKSADIQALLTLSKVNVCRKLILYCCKIDNVIAVRIFTVISSSLKSPSYVLPSAIDKVPLPVREGKRNFGLVRVRSRNKNKKRLVDSVPHFPRDLPPFGVHQMHLPRTDPSG